MVARAFPPWGPLCAPLHGHSRCNGSERMINPLRCNGWKIGRQNVIPRFSDWVYVYYASTTTADRAESRCQGITNTDPRREGKDDDDQGGKTSLLIMVKSERLAIKGLER